MGIAKKQGSIATIITYAGIVIGYINVAFLFPLFMDNEQLGVSSAESLGLRQLLVNFATLSSQISLLGFATVTTKYLPFVRDNDAMRKSFLGFITLIPTLGAIVLGIVIYLLEDWIKAQFATEAALFNTYFYLVFPMILFFTLTAVYEFYCKSLFKSIPPVLLKEVVLKLLGVLLISLYALKVVSYELFWSLFVGTYGVVLLVLVIYLASIRKMSLRFNKLFTQVIKIRPLVNYATFSLMSGSASTIILYIDGIMISYFIGLGNNGIYTIAIFIATLVDVPRRSLLQIMGPIISEASKKEDKVMLKEAYTKSSLTMLIAGLGVFLLIVLNLDKLYEFIPNHEVYKTGFYATCFLGLTKLIHMTFSINAEIVNYSKYYRFNLYNNIFLAILGIVTNAILIPIYGITGTGLATMISYTLFNISFYSFVKIKFGISPFTAATFYTLLIGGSVFGLVYSLPDIDDKYLSVLLKSTLIIGLYGGAIVGLKISPDVNDLVFKILKRKR